MVICPCSFALRVVIVLSLVASSASAGWALGGVGDDDKKGKTTGTLNIQPVPWEPYISEFHVLPPGDGETYHKGGVLKMEKPEGELPGVARAWKSLKERFGFDNLGERNEARNEIISGWTRSETGFLVHASSQYKPNGDAKIVQELLAEAPSYLYSAVSIDFANKLAADQEAYVLDKHFKAIALKITAHDIARSGVEFNPADIGGTSEAEPLLKFDFEADFSRPWKQISGWPVSGKAPDQNIDPWRYSRFVEWRLQLEVEGRLNDAEEPMRKKVMGAIRHIVLPPKDIQIDILFWERGRK